MFVDLDNELLGEFAVLALHLSRRLAPNAAKAKGKEQPREKGTGTTTIQTARTN